MYRTLQTICRATLLALTFKAGMLLAADDKKEETQSQEDFEEKLKQARAVPKVENPNRYGGFFGGVTGAFGQAYSTAGGSPGAGFVVQPEVGYIVQSDSWNRLEFSLAGQTGVLNFKDDDGKGSVTMGFGLMPRFGYGYVLGGKTLGMVRLGLGFVQGKFDYKTSIGTIKADAEWGVASLFGYEVVYQLNDVVEVLGGLDVTHYVFNYSKASFAGATIDDFDHTVEANLIAANVGLRLKF